MSKLAVLKIGDGDFENGFPVTLRISEDGNSTVTEIDGWLPPAPNIPAQYDSWQFSYRTCRLDSPRTLTAKAGQETNHSIIDVATQLQHNLNEWLNSGDRGFQKIRDRLLQTLSQKDEEVRLLIQSADDRLWRLPWHLWHEFERHPQVEVALGYSEYEQESIISPSLSTTQVRILVIVGDNTGIDVQKDLDLLKQRLPDAYIRVLTNPKHNQLNDELWEQNWDILFFAGHSGSELGSSKGRIYLNPITSLTIKELKFALKKAIGHGLSLAIFNSCDGLGLARDLAPLQIPAMIVMRERVPDPIAQKFLEYFLSGFAIEKKSLYTSVRQARERLHGLEGDYPCASWLPIICQNPAVIPPTWQQLQRQSCREHPLMFSPRYKPLFLLLISSTLLWGLNTLRTNVFGHFFAAIPAQVCQGSSCGDGEPKVTRSGSAEGDKEKALTKNALRNKVPPEVVTKSLPNCVQNDCNCTDFKTQAEAQKVLEAFPDDPHDLDRNHDGMACEGLLKSKLKKKANQSGILK